VKDLPPQYRVTLQVLAGILRVANALDRSHFGVVRSIDCKINAKTVELILTTTDDAALEVWAGKERSDILTAAFGREITLTTRMDVDPT
jgi:exopolyphosphatase / guanosine-5'-triphosphate,3'-diphosphate pyrophosphatase